MGMSEAASVPPNNWRALAGKALLERIPLPPWESPEGPPADWRLEACLLGAKVRHHSRQRQVKPSLFTSSHSVKRLLWVERTSLKKKKK